MDKQQPRSGCSGRSHSVNIPRASLSILFSMSFLAVSLFCCNFLQFHGWASKRAQLCHWMNALIYSASTSVLPLDSNRVMAHAREYVGARVCVCVLHWLECNMSSVVLVPCFKKRAVATTCGSPAPGRNSRVKTQHTHTLTKRHTRPQRTTREHNEGLYLPSA